MTADAERSRLAALHAYDILDTPADPVLDRITALAADLFATPASGLSLIDADRQWLISHQGAVSCEIPRDHAFCDHAIRLPRGAALLVEDARLDPRFRENPLVACKGGARFYLGTPLIDPNGHALGALCVVDVKPRTDVSEAEIARLVALADLAMEHLNLRRAAAEVASSQRLLRLAETVAGVGHWSLRRDGRVFWSDEVYRIHGLDPASFDPNLDSAIDRFHPEDRSRVSDAVQQALATGAGYSFELRLVRADGAVRKVTSRAICERDDSGEVATVFGVFQDVTEQSELMAAATSAAQAKSDFLANMSHELRTPLNSIIGFTHVLMREDGLAADQRQKLQRIEEAGRGLLTIVNDVLDFSKIEAAGVELRQEPFSPARLVETVAALVEPQAVEKGLSLDIDCAIPRLQRVTGDSDRLRQVLMNLLTNAVKFTQAGRVRLSVRARPDDADLALSFQVTDTGLGMSPEQVETLFHRFAQADGSISRRFGGTGLGLAISKQLIEAMDGEIEVWSELGYGSSFEVRLKLPAAAAACEPGSEDGPASAGGRALAGLRVLAAEDVPVNQELLRLMLAPLGCEVTVVDHGGAAVEAIERQAFDLVLMDMQMPVMDGLEAARMIRRLGGDAARTPIVALTANVLPEQIERCRRAGMNDHIAKPFVTADLQAMVAKWAGHAPVEGQALAASSDGNQVLDELIAQLGEGPIRGLLAGLDVQLAHVLEAAPDTQGAALAGVAHSLRGASATLGYVEVAAACNAVETAHRERGEIDGPLSALQSACRALRERLATRLAA